MSTQNVKEEAEQARESLGKLASKVRARVNEIGRNLNGLDRESENVEIGARAAQRAIRDDREVLDEERQQLTSVLTGPEPEQPEAPTQPEEILPAPEPEPQPEETPPVPTPVPPAEPEVTATQTTNWWRRLCNPWLLAIIVGLIVLVLSSIWYDNILELADGDAGWGENGLVRFLFITGPPLLAGYWTWIISRAHCPE